jgi:hypothetical protein
MKTNTLTFVTAITLGLAAGACSSSGSDEIAVPTPDAAVARDSGSTAATDSGSTTADTGTTTETDAGSTVDAGNLPDASTPIDAGSPVDASTPVDAGSPVDASTPVDAGSADAGTATDAGTIPVDSGADATVATDSGVDAGAAQSGATCASPDVVTAPLSATYTMSTSYANDYTSGTTCSFYSGNDRVFAVDVPAGKRLYTSVRGVGSFDPSISLVAAPATCTSTGMTCLAGNDTGTPTSLNFLTTTNSAATTTRYLVIVDASTTTVGDYDFRAVVGDALPGDTCATAQTITLASGSASLGAQTVDLYANDYNSGTGCSGFTGGERVYRLDVPANTAVGITATPDANFDVAVNVVEGAAGATPETACASSISCTTSANAGTAGAAERAIYRNTTAATKTIFVTVEAAVSTTVPGGFALAVNTIVAPAGDTCATVPTVTFSGNTASVTGDSLVDALNDYGTGTSCSGTAGPDRGYAVSIPAGKILTVTATATGSGTTFNPSLNIVDSAACGAGSRTCLVGSDVAGQAETVRYNNTSGSAANVVVFVETSAAAVAMPGTYDLAFALSDPPSGETCANATAVTAGSLSSQTLLGYTSDFGSGTSCSGTAGPDRLYKITVPAGQRLTATVTPESVDGSANWDPSINLQLAAGCVATGRVCLAGSDNGASGAADTATWTNNTGSPAEVFIAVETYTSSAPAAGAVRNFTLDVGLTTPPPAPAGDVCSTASTIGAGTVTDETLIGFGNDYGTGTNCSGTAGPDHLYKVSVPAGQRLTATVTPKTPDGGTSWDPAINLQDATACAAPSSRTCLAGSDNGYSGDPDTISWTNSSASAVDVYVAVETFSSTSPAVGATRTYDLTIAFSTPVPAPADDVCLDASTLISASTTLASESLANYTSNYGSASNPCATVSSTNGGIDRAYRVRIGAGQTFTATITPDASWDPTLSLVLGAASACTSSLVCAAGDDTGYDGTAETITYTNNTAAAVDAFLIVDSWDPTSPTTFPYSLAITLTP